ETAHRRGYRFIGKVVQVGAAPPSSTRSIELVGRQTEIDRLNEWLNEALSGRRQVVFVTGEAGAGKTSVVEAVLETASRDTGILIASGQCLEQYGETEPYLPILEALGRLCRATGEARLRDLLRRYAPTWLAQMPALIGGDDREALRREILGATPQRMLRE